MYLQMTTLKVKHKNKGNLVQSWPCFALGETLWHFVCPSASTRRSFCSGRTGRLGEVLLPAPCALPSSSVLSTGMEPAQAGGGGLLCRSLTHSTWSSPCLRAKPQWTTTETAAPRVNEPAGTEGGLAKQEALYKTIWRWRGRWFCKQAEAACSSQDWVWPRADGSGKSSAASAHTTADSTLGLAEVSRSSPWL